MSKYVDKKHGMTIGSDNIFFVIDRADPDEPELVLPEGVSDIRDGYRALVSFKSYYFDQMNSINVFVRTPADQIVWTERILKWETPWERPNGETMMLPYHRRYKVLSNWATHWLKENVGEQYDAWDTYTRGTRNRGCVFFKRRKDALAFVNAVTVMLEGMHFGP